MAPTSHPHSFTPHFCPYQITIHPSRRSWCKSFSVFPNIPLTCHCERCETPWRTIRASSSLLSPLYYQILLIKILSPIFHPSPIPLFSPSIIAKLSHSVAFCRILSGLSPIFPHLANAWGAAFADPSGPFIIFPHPCGYLHDRCPSIQIVLDKLPRNHIRNLSVHDLVPRIPRRKSLPQIPHPSV